MASVSLIAIISMGSPPAESQQAVPNRLATNLGAMITSARSLSEARIGIYAATLDGTPLYSRNADESFNTASNTKIVTIAAGLALLGPDFQFTTALYGTDVSADVSTVGTLYLRGGADPALGLADIRELARDLALRGVTKVDRVAVDDSYFDDEDLPPHFDEQPEEDASFRAPINAAGLAFNSYAIYITGVATGRGPARVALDPRADYLVLKSTAVSTVTRGRTRLRVSQKSVKGKLEIEIRGQIRAGATRVIRRRIPDPNPFANSVLRSALRSEGIAVRSGAAGNAEVPPGAILLAARRSAPLAVLVRGLGKYSNNYMAEVLLKTIGAETKDGDGPASWEDGRTAVRAYLTEQIGLESFTYENGSGLFESNRFTPAQIVQVLTRGAADFRYGPELIGSLAIAGVDGTLRSRLEETSAVRQVRAKTGTLAQVSALAGYAGLDSRAPIVFAVLVNEVPRGKLGSARELQDQVAEALVIHAREQLGR
jgi:D-alanyl-D-alanine carboxypeptidase/D-alanyl-D-alanine-endopeptidase (penicillin-binding protein 4)